MAQPDRSGLSNPYAPAPVTAPSRSRTGLARAAVLAGVGGAATLGLAGAGTGSAWAEPGTTTPVSRYDRAAACMPLSEPVLHGRTAVGHEPASVSRRCRVPASWWRQGPVERPLPTYPARPPRSPGDPIAGSQVVSVEGTVEAGVEPGCEVLRDGEGRQWTLTGPLGTLPRGVPLTVAGVTAPDQLTTCQQGSALRVRQVSLLNPATEPGPTVPIATTNLLTAGARPVRIPPAYTDVEPACGPTAKIPTKALCTR